jgi:signal peptidase I
MEKIDEDIKRKKRLIKRLKLDAIIKTSGFIAAMIITFGFVFGVAAAPTNDMFPAVHKGDLIIYYRLGRIINTDVVVYEAPDGSMQIGRVEGTQGETAGVTDGGLLTINGNIQPAQKRSGLYDETYAGEKNISGEIGEGEFLVLGDSRETAKDSRAFGLIPRKSIKGKAFSIIRRIPL